MDQNNSINAFIYTFIEITKRHSILRYAYRYLQLYFRCVKQVLKAPAIICTASTRRMRAARELLLGRTPSSGPIIERRLSVCYKFCLNAEKNPITMVHVTDQRPFHQSDPKSFGDDYANR